MIVGRRGKSSKWVNHTRNVACRRNADVSRSSSEGRVAIGISGGLESCRWHLLLSIKSRGEWLGKPSLIAPTTGRGEAIGGLLWRRRTPLTLRWSAHAHCTGTNATRGLKTKGWAGEGGRVDSGHPDTSLIDFEEICDERIEVDVGVCEVIECEFLPVPAQLSVNWSNFRQKVCAGRQGQLDRRKAYI